MPKKQKKAAPAPEPRPKDFLDMIAPAAVKFNIDHYVLGGAYHCVMAVRGYSTATEALALMSHLGEHSGVTISIYIRRVTAAEEQKIIQNASNRSRFERSNTNDSCVIAIQQIGQILVFLFDAAENAKRTSFYWRVHAALIAPIHV